MKASDLINLIIDSPAATALFAHMSTAVWICRLRDFPAKIRFLILCGAKPADKFWIPDTNISGGAEILFR